MMIEDLRMMIDDKWLRVDDDTHRKYIDEFLHKIHIEHGACADVIILQIYVALHGQPLRLYRGVFDWKQQTE